MTRPHGTVSWFSVGSERWPEEHWSACDTWINGHKLYARMSCGGDMGRPPVVMIHGAVVSGNYFGPIARRLEDTCRVCIPDLPGFGRSSASKVLTLAEQAAAVDAWMEIHGLRSAVIVGNSTGCQVATWLASAHPARVARLVLLAPTMDPNVRTVLALAWRGSIDIPRERQSLWPIWIGDLLSAGIPRAIRCLTDAIGDNQAARLASVRQPVVCVGGERDPICPPSWVSALAKSLPNARAVILPGAAHALNFSSPDGVAAVLQEEMAGSSGGGRVCD